MQLQTTSHTVEWLPYNQNNKCWWECRETRPTRPVCGNVKCHCRKQYRSCSKVLRSGIYGSHGNLFFNFFVPIFTATLYTIAKTWQPPKCPSISGCINRMCSLLMEWCSWNLLSLFRCRELGAPPRSTGALLRRLGESWAPSMASSVLGHCGS